MNTEKGHCTDMDMILTGSAAAAVSTALFTGFRKISDEDGRRENALMWALISFSVYLITDIAAALCMHRTGRTGYDILSFVLTANFLFLLSVTDIRYRRIPNVYILAAFAVKTVMIVIWGVAEHDFSGLFVNSLAGVISGALLTGIVYVISGKGIGAGDVKMFAAVGYMAGAAAALDILVYSTVLCALCGIILVAVKKCRLKDFIPMAPFVYAGMLVYIFSGM